MGAFLGAQAQSICAAIITILVGAAGWYSSVGLDFGTLERLGPAAVPMTVSVALIVLGVVQLGGVVRAALVESEATPVAPGRSWLAILLAAIVLAAVLGMIVGPTLAPRELILNFGPSDLFAWYVATLILGVVAVLLLSTVPVVQLISSVLIGVGLGLIGVDLDSGVTRLSTIDLNFLHGLLLALVARFFGFSVFLIALGFASAIQLEENLRRALLIWRGDYLAFASRPIAATLLSASLFILLGAVLVRRFVVR